MPNPLGECVTTVLVSNLHCSSCVQTIQQALKTLTPPPSIDISIVSQSVTVYHSPELTSQAISSIIESQGFDVTPDLPPNFPFIDNRTPILHYLTLKQKTHLGKCSWCQDALRAQEEKPAPQHSDSTCLQPSSHPLGLTIGGAAPPVLYRINAAIGGMTCASCLSTISKALTDLSGVSNVAISLVNKSGYVCVDSKERVSQVIETVEDCGFEILVLDVEEVSQDRVMTNIRTISLQIEEMFCQDCPKRIMASLAVYGDQIQVKKAVIDVNDPILTISYRPNAPLFTIRHIISTMSTVKVPPYPISVHHSPSLEQLTQQMHTREQKRFLRRLALNVVIAIPTFIIGIVFMSLVADDNPQKKYFMSPMWDRNASRAEWALFFLSTPVMFYSANVFHRRSIKEIRALWRRESTTPILRRFIRFGSMNMLVSTGVSVAYFSSIALLVLAVSRKNHSNTGDRTTYFDSVVFLTMFLLAGRCIESYSKARTADAVTALKGLRPRTALLVSPSSAATTSSLASSPGVDVEKASIDDSVLTPTFSTVQTTPVELLEIGDIVRIPVGASPPADGVVIPGHSSSFDESSLTGESKSVAKQWGDTVYMGTINKLKMVDIKVEKIGNGTMLDRIVTVVREGQTRRAPIERIADLITGYFVPVVTLISTLTWVIWLSLGYGGILPADYLDIPLGGWAIWSLQFSIAVFVVACPCGIGLAAPTALLVGSGLAARNGILARGGGEAFQEMAQLDVLVFDKTGTLTEGGNPQVTDAIVMTADEKALTEKHVLSIALTLEEMSSHPLALAIQGYCKRHDAQSMPSVNQREEVGRGLRSTFQDLNVTAIIGNENWLEQHDAPIDEHMAEQAASWRAKGQTAVFLALQDISIMSRFKTVASFAIADVLRSEAANVVSRMQRQGIDTWMITGDNHRTASAVATMVGILPSNVIAGVLPHEKANAIRRLQRGASIKARKSWCYSDRQLQNRRIVGMVGDGINDAPALAVADIGIAVGSGSDVAISSASFILLSSNLHSLVTLIDLSHTVFNRVKFNFLWATCYNIVAVPIAAGVLYPAGHIRLDPVWASLAMALSSLSVICSSLLLRLYKEPKISDKMTP